MAATDRRRARVEPLSRDRVLHAAIRYADEHGIASLSMRRLGEVLGVEAMSLYNHVANKAQLLDGMVDLVFAQVELPTDAADWRGAEAGGAAPGPPGPAPPPVCGSA